MRWDNPELLLLWWCLPFLVGIYVWGYRRRRRMVDAFAEHHLVKRLAPRLQTSRYVFRASLVTVGIGLLIAGAARPRWGVYYEQVESRGVDLFILLDVSRSMLAEDVAPNRLERAKSDIRDLLPKLEGDRVGLIVFAGAAAVKVPLTTDQGFFRMALDEVDPLSAPRGGTAIGDALRKGMEAMELSQDRDQAFVLITDGEDHDSFPKQAAEQAVERGIQIFTIGLGDVVEGRRIPLLDDQGNRKYVQHEGQEIWSKMDEGLLKEIALLSGGAYIPARTQTYDLGQVYEDHLASLTQGELDAEQRKRYRERFQLFLLLGLAMLLLDQLIPRDRRTPVDGISPG